LRVIFSGARIWTDPEPVQAALNCLVRKAGSDPLTIVHGAARGLDALAGSLAALMPGVTVEAHPADWNTHGKAAGHLRNQKMVDLGADLAMAFPLGESRGTRDFIRRAQAAGIRVIVWNEGSGWSEA
jgi:hypothetical protein